MVFRFPSRRLARSSEGLGVIPPVTLQPAEFARHAQLAIPGKCGEKRNRYDDILNARGEALGEIREIASSDLNFLDDLKPRDRMTVTL